MGDTSTVQGWAWGTTYGKDPDGDEWLTIAGSAYKTPKLTAEPGNATGPVTIIGRPQVLALVHTFWNGGVTITGTAFRIAERAPEHLQHRLVLAVHDKDKDLVTGWCTCSTWDYDYYHRKSVLKDGWSSDEYTYPRTIEERYLHHHILATVQARVEGYAAVTGDGGRNFYWFDDNCRKCDTTYDPMRCNGVPCVAPMDHALNAVNNWRDTHSNPTVGRVEPIYA